MYSIILTLVLRRNLQWSSLEIYDRIKSLSRMALFSPFLLRNYMASYMHRLVKGSLANKAKRITEKLTLSNILVDLLNYLILNHLFCDLIIKQNPISFADVFHTFYFFLEQYHHHWKTNCYLRLVYWCLIS